MNLFLKRYSDIALALMVVGIVAMLIIPLPTRLVDLLLTINISLAVVLLLTSIYLDSAIRFSVFPSILLLSTLFRLALNVSTTRLILLQADAGEVVSAFGQFVVRGNTIVGVVIFLILTIIQFVVIAKGSERVAEVAARFTLDAMPGKQMAIDADLRSGSIDLKQAGQRRELLQRESRLYGAMDGAMKFVKGDAIAGIIITAINILAGLTIGVLQQGMTLGDAVQLYSLLTIGDGLVSQIPALLIATTAGIVVTRVNGEDEKTHLGQDIAQQLLEYPKAIAITAAFLMLFALIPGMPTIPFFILAASVGLLAYKLLRKPRTPLEAGPRRDHTGAVAGEAAQSQPHCPLSVSLGFELATHLEKSGAEGTLREAIQVMRERFLRQFGVRIPAVRVTPEKRRLGPWDYQIEIDEIPGATFSVAPGCVLAKASAEDLEAHGLSPLESIHPASGEPASWIPEEQKQAVEVLGVGTLPVSEILMLHLARLIKDNLRLFVGVQEVQDLLDELESTHPALVKAVVPRMVPIVQFAEVLGRLVEEEISVRNLRLILQTIAELGGKAKHTVELAEIARGGLKREISHRFSKGTNELNVLLVDHRIEEMIRASIRQTNSGPILSLDPEVSRDILASLERANETARAAGGQTILLTQSDVRRYLKKICDTRFPNSVILSYQELLPTLQVKPLGKVVLGRGSL